MGVLMPFDFCLGKCFGVCKLYVEEARAEVDSRILCCIILFLETTYWMQIVCLVSSTHHATDPTCVVGSSLTVLVSTSSVLAGRCGDCESNERLRR